MYNLVHYSPSMLGSPSSRDSMYLLRNSVQKLKKYQSARCVSVLELQTPASASITVVSVMVIFSTGSPGVLSLRASSTRSDRGRKLPSEGQGQGFPEPLMLQSTTDTSRSGHLRIYNTDWDSRTSRDRGGGGGGGLNIHYQSTVRV